MGSFFKGLAHYVAEDGDLDREANPVLKLAVESAQRVLNQCPEEKLSHLILATSGPDHLAPSLGQELRRQLKIVDCLTIDIGDNAMKSGQRQRCNADIYQCS